MYFSICFVHRKRLCIRQRLLLNNLLSIEQQPVYNIRKYIIVVERRFLLPLSDRFPGK